MTWAPTRRGARSGLLANGRPVKGDGREPFGTRRVDPETRKRELAVELAFANYWRRLDGLPPISSEEET